jgi:radical SAM protein with 4Fe4S-binding SPASM domain
MTYKCNNNCFYCFSPGGQTKANELTTEEAFKFIDQAADLGIPRLILSGGEPLMRPDFFELVKRMKDDGLGVKLATNFSLLNKEKIDKIDKLGVYAIQAPIDSLDPKTYCAIRKCSINQFNTVMKNIELIKDTHLHTVVGCVLTKLNKDEPSKLMEFCYDQNIDTLTVYQPVPIGHCTHKNLLTIPEYLEQVKKILDEFVTYDKKWLVEVEAPAFDSYKWIHQYSNKVNLNFAGCKAGRRVCAMTPEGNIIPCPCTDVSLFYQGNVRQQKLKDIWEGGFKLFRQPPKNCQGCKEYSRCMGGCRALAYGYTGRTDGIDPTCVKLLR